MAHCIIDIATCYAIVHSISFVTVKHLKLFEDIFTDYIDIFIEIGRDKLTYISFV